MWPAHFSQKTFQQTKLTARVAAKAGDISGIHDATGQIDRKLLTVEIYHAKALLKQVHLISTPENEIHPNLGAELYIILPYMHYYYDTNVLNVVSRTLLNYPKVSVYRPDLSNMKPKDSGHDVQECPHFSIHKAHYH